MRAKITKASIDKLKPGDYLADTEVKGFTARCLPSNAVTYGLRYRFAGKQRWLPLGMHGSITPSQARTFAKKRAGEVAGGRDPAAERETGRQKAKDDAESTVDAILDGHVARHVRKNLRSAAEVERVFNRYVRPQIGSKSIYELRRRDIVEMLDAVDDGGAPVMADRVLAHVRKAFNWHAARDDDFNSPIVKGMARTKPMERARKRVLADQELRDVWKALDTAKLPSCYPAFVRTLLLTAQRRGEVAGMSWPEIDGDVWVIPAERGETQGHKTGDQTGDMAVPLTAAVLELHGKPRKRGFVFSTNGREPFSGFSKAKRALDAEVAKLRKAERRPAMPHWTHHDLRRTARSLVSRAGVSADIAERVLGHVIPGVRGVYDRYEYIDEKRDALERLTALVEQILHPPPGNVIALSRASTAQVPREIASSPA
jgi:integrase